MSERLFLERGNIVSKAKKSVPARRPEKKFGPFHNGIGLAIWLNQIETENATRYFRSNVA